MTDRPDFSPSRGVDIIASSIDSLPIDIVSESIGELAVDVAATSVGTLGIDVEAQTLGDLEIDIATQSLNVVDQETVAVPSESIAFVELIDGSTVSANGGFKDIFIRPPEGQIWEVVTPELFVQPPADATSGTHQFIVRSETEAIDVLEGESTFDTEVNYRNGYWQSANDTAAPPDTAAQSFMPRGLRIDSENGLQIEYDNLSDADTNRNREIRLWLRQIKVAV